MCVISIVPLASCATKASEITQAVLESLQKQLRSNQQLARGTLKALEMNVEVVSRSGAIAAHAFLLLTSGASGKRNTKGFDIDFFFWACFVVLAKFESLAGMVWMCFSSRFLFWFDILF